MPLLVLAYPDISQQEMSWIQSIRDERDELYAKVVEPHFTLVFPADIDEATLIAHVKQRAKTWTPFSFTLKCAVIAPDAFSEYTHVFLVPDEGYSNLVKLHDSLYTGILEGELRLDIPFIPHIGIANSKDAKSCKHLADKLNREDFAVKGIIEMLDIVRLEDNKVSTIQQIALSTG